MNEMPIKVSAYAHQKNAYEFALRLFGVSEGGDAVPISRGCFYMMDMG